MAPHAAMDDGPHKALGDAIPACETRLHVRFGRSDATNPQNLRDRQLGTTVLNTTRIKPHARFVFTVPLWRRVLQVLRAVVTLAPVEVVYLLSSRTRTNEYSSDEPVDTEVLCPLRV